MRIAIVLAAAAIVTATCGCASSVVIPETDATFARATDRFERTSSTVEAAEPDARARASFLQAEALYRYRFASTRGGAASVAEAAAAITDFPVFQSLAGSLDLMDVRLRTADAAVQLWETFLQRHRCSPLRPLALYRLGFAYRSTSVEGLPRESGDEAFDEAASAPGAFPDLTTAIASARQIRWKSKRAAATWSLVPGLGQFYVGEPLSGAVRLAVALAAAAAVVVPTVIALTRSDELTWKNDWPLLVTGVGGVIVLSFDYTSSYEDAMRGVVHFNERAEAKFENEHPEAP